MSDYIRIACAVPQVQVGNVKKNVEAICAKLREAEEKSVDLLVFPELALTGYTCGDLFFQQPLHRAVTEGMEALLDASADHPSMTVVVGTPYYIDGQLYNCAAVICGGILRGLVPKTYIPNYGQAAESRWFARSEDLCQHPIAMEKLGLEGDYYVPLTTRAYFTVADAKVGVEICEDLWVPISPSAQLALGGAEVIVNLAASNELVGKHTFRRDMVTHQSAACICGYAFCSAGAGESSQDTVYSGHSIIAQNGTVLAENDKLADTDYLLVTDMDLSKIRADRMRTTSFRDVARDHSMQYAVECLECADLPLRSDGTLHPVTASPFLPENGESREQQCMDIFKIQVAGLKRRLSAIGAKAVIGVSGGLDSTLALLVTVAAMEELGRPLTDVYGVTMPCFGTSDRTCQNARKLMTLLGITSREIPIQKAVEQHFRDIGHDPENHDTTYENAQARERTQVLMDLAGEVEGIVVGTGDLSELALGWCTYNGDHMSMYAVNSSVPKTVIPGILEAVAKTESFEKIKEVLADIVATPISPELLPPDETGKIRQQTEDIVGPYALHDFFLYYVLRYGFAPKKIYVLACRAFAGEYDSATVKKWLVTFYRRFFTQQFKRNCQPDGVKVGSVAVGSRYDLQMPSDASGVLWLEEAESI